MIGPAGFMAARKPEGASFCWECGKKLTRHHGELNFREVTPPGGTPVRVHVECAKNYNPNPPAEAQRNTRRAVRKYLAGGDRG